MAIASAPPDDRESLLSRECQGDAALRAEVERLLAHDAWAGDFLESPAARLPSLMAQIPPDLPVFAEGETVSARYRIVRRIGAGGMGEVYQAEDLALGCQAAIKTIRPEIAGDLRTLARFKREIQLGRSVTHRNVCRVFDIAVHQSPAGVQTTYLTMEMVEGETLAALLERKGVLSLAEALPLIHQMVAALDAAHRAGIVHRDFKPSNVIVAGPQNDPRVVVTDFGLASTVEVP
ncbi:MAG TPA: serine/threonine-protein kinase, partial [Candidatus Sulfopaludibacter sp.]|nr:serine/threonine-protein kinase [Candidatus Sulfopaludibacter sp.]